MPRRNPSKPLSHDEPHTKRREMLAKLSPEEQKKAKLVAKRLILMQLHREGRLIQTNTMLH